MHHYLHQLVAMFVFLLFGGERVVYWGFLKIFPENTACCDRKQRYENVRVNQNCEYMDQAAKL